MNSSNGDQWSSLTSILKYSDNSEDVDELSEETTADVKPSVSPTASHKEVNLMAAVADDDLVTRLASSGATGAAAAAAMVSVRKKNARFCFETNPLRRKRIKTKMLRKLQQLIREFAARVGWQAVVLVATPEATNANYKVFGSKPLETVIVNLKSIVMNELEESLTYQASEPARSDPLLFELPPLLMDGIPTTVENMTQSHLRTFILIMLKYSTGRAKPRWGRESTRPPWWPKDIPWANVRVDHRSKEEKRKVSWTNALRKILISCYKYHGRKDLLLTFTEEDDKENDMATANENEVDHSTVLHTVTNPDGSMSIVKVDSKNPVIVFEDESTTHLEGVAIVQSPQSDRMHIHAIETVNDENDQAETIDFNSTTEILANENSAINVTNSAPILVPCLYIADNDVLRKVPVFQVPFDPSAHCILIQGLGDNASLDPQILFPKDATLLTEAVINSNYVPTDINTNSI